MGIFKGLFKNKNAENTTSQKKHGGNSVTYYWIKFNTDFGTKTVCAKNDKDDVFQTGDRVKFNGYGYSGFAIIDKKIEETPTTKEIYEITAP